MGEGRDYHGCGVEYKVGDGPRGRKIRRKNLDLQKKKCGWERISSYWYFYTSLNVDPRKRSAFYIER